ncbi:hypothetical protein DIPPA_09434 [Diplonema papillatum]|nr:hypothetical protein DIPPA_09434 [Diplonema papillatum]
MQRWIAAHFNSLRPVDKAAALYAIETCVTSGRGGVPSATPVEGTELLAFDFDASQATLFLVYSIMCDALPSDIPRLGRVSVHPAALSGPTSASSAKRPRSDGDAALPAAPEKKKMKLTKVNGPAR